MGIFPSIGIGIAVSNMIKADKNNSQADKINIKAFNKEELAKEEARKKENLANLSIEKLANRKRGILITSMKEFIDVYERIKKINFSEGEGIKELYESEFNISQLDEMKTMISVAGYSMNTRQLIASMLIKGGISGVIVKESELNLDVASIRRRQADVVSSHMETISVGLDAIHMKTEKLADLLAKLNILFTKSIKVSKTIIDEKGNNKLSYTREDKECLMNCINLAATIKKIIDKKLIDENGEITLKYIDVIEVGDIYLKKINTELIKGD